MIYYGMILLAVLCFASQFAFTKLFSANTKSGIVSGGVMLIIPCFIASVYLFCLNGFRVEVTGFSVFWAIIFAFIKIPYFILGIKILSYGSLAIYSMFMMLGGMAVPFFYGVLFLNEALTVGKVIGSVLLVIFIVLQAVWQKDSTEEKDSRSAKTKSIYFILCIAAFFLNGFVSVIIKTHQIGGDRAVGSKSFSMLACFFAAILSTIMLIITLICSKDKEQNKQQLISCFKWVPLVAILGIGIISYTGEIFHLSAASFVPASVQFPMVSGGTIVFSAIIAAIFFKEKPSKKELICLTGAFVSTFMFAF